MVTIKMIKIFIVVIVVLAIGGGVYYWLNEKKQTSVVSEDGQLNEEQIETVLKEISELIRIDSATEPLVATITDADRLKGGQAFYAGAKNGDILLIFPDISKAVIYDQADNVLVNVGPVILNDEQQEVVDVQESENDSSASSNNPSSNDDTNFFQNINNDN